MTVLATPEAAEGFFEITVPKPGIYWFAIQVEGSDGKQSPTDAPALEPLVKVKVDPEEVMPPKRDVLKEIEQLRDTSSAWKRS